MLAILGAVIALLGIGDLVGGVAFEPTTPLAITGRTVTELQAGSPDAFRLIDFRAREGGISLLIVGLLLALIACRPYRMGQGWSWWAMWALPAWASSVLMATLAYGLAPGQSPSGAALSGPVISLVAAVVLVADRPRFSTFRE